MSYDSLTNRGEYLSAHYLAEQLPKDLRRKPDGLLHRWDERERDGKPTPRSGLRSLGKVYTDARPILAGFSARAAEETGRRLDDVEEYRKTLHELHGAVLRALGFDAVPQTITVDLANKPYEVEVAHSENGVVAIECGWAPNADAALDPDQAGLLLSPAPEGVLTGEKLASRLFTTDEPPRYVLILAGGVVILADRLTWHEGRYLGVSLDVALGRREVKELETIGALFGADSLLPPEEGGAELLSTLVTESSKHAVGVSKDLRDGLKESVEIIANEVLDRLREQGVIAADFEDPRAFAKELGREALRYLYRILFLLYAEARPELGVLPVDHEEYVKGYSLGRLGDIVVRDLVSEESRRGFHLYESLDLLFRMVNDGYRARNGEEAGTSEAEGIRFEPLKADLFDPVKTRLLGSRAIHPNYLDVKNPDESVPRFDTRLRNAALYQVLRLLMLAKGKRNQRGGFISYAQLGINQLGAVYEGLMSYTGFIADDELYEVAKGGDPKDGSWMIPASKADNYPDDVFVIRADDNGFKTGERVRYKPGSFVYRLAGRDRESSASYYTPESLTKVTVELALKERLDQDGTTTKAREILDWKICEPAVGSGAFLNEAINQVAAEYLKRRQAELGENLDPECYTHELQKTKAYIALHNSYGVDLNETGVELAEVSLWLNVMHSGLQAPWFGLHLKRGNSLIGAGRRLYAPDLLDKRQWLSTTPQDVPLVEKEIPQGHIHHFLLPAPGWGAVAAEREAKNLAPEDAEKLAAWRKAITKAPSAKKKQGQKLSQIKRLQGLSARIEYLWKLVVRRLEISEREISRPINVWGASDLPHPTEIIHRDQVLEDLKMAGTPYWRLKTLMDAWCALWFWPVDKANLLDGSHEQYAHISELDASLPGINFEELTAPVSEEVGLPATWEADSLFGDSQAQLSLGSTPARSSRSTRPSSKVTRRSVIPLADLDDWLDFAEALIGVADIPEDSLGSQLNSLADLDEHEDQLQGWMGMDSPLRIEDRFPWFSTVIDLADRQGFFHWELQFAQVLQKGGFDLQVGNPPWVRPLWQEDVVLAEFDPWFKLVDKPTIEEWGRRKEEEIFKAEALAGFIDELTANTAMVEFLSSSTTYPLITGTQPDLYRAFMCRTWNSLSSSGVSGLIHPGSHFGGVREGRLRSAAYERLRVHAKFINAANWAFDDLSRTQEFGLHVYGRSREINFMHFSDLYGAEVVSRSLEHDGEGPVPGIKHAGSWDVRPHNARVIRVDKGTLAEWKNLVGNSEGVIEQTPLLYPVTRQELGAIRALASYSIRLGDFSPQMSSGYHEAGDKKKGRIRWSPSPCLSWKDVILQGPHFGVATPLAKQPPHFKSSDQPRNLMALGVDEIPSSNYERACGESDYYSAQDRWLDYGRIRRLCGNQDEVTRTGGEIRVVPDSILGRDEGGLIATQIPGEARHPYSCFYRLAWRRMIPFNGERSLFAALVPPGPAHVHTVYTMALPDNLGTALAAGFWAALPLDYLLRITGRADLQSGEAAKMPAADPGHPLTSALLLRTLRLNSLTKSFGDLWGELYVHAWRSESWAVDWPMLPALHAVGPAWDESTPLRTERARRAALVELDAMVALWLGMSAEELAVIYKSRYPVLADYEAQTWFDANGRKIAGNHNTYGFGQTKDDYKLLMERVEAKLDELGLRVEDVTYGMPINVEPPEGYAAPFYKADREGEYRRAHAVFAERLREAGGS